MSGYVKFGTLIPWCLFDAVDLRNLVTWCTEDVRKDSTAVDISGREYSRLCNATQTLNYFIVLNISEYWVFLSIVLASPSSNTKQQSSSLTHWVTSRYPSSHHEEYLCQRLPAVRHRKVARYCVISSHCFLFSLCLWYDADGGPLFCSHLEDKTEARTIVSYTRTSLTRFRWSKENCISR